MSTFTTLLVIVVSFPILACDQQPSAARQEEEGRQVVPQYSPDTGRLDQLVVKREETGGVEARAFMKGTTFERIELDTDGDGTPDRWEYYTATGQAGTSGVSGNPIVRAEEATRGDGRISRWEYYDGGAIARVEEDVNGDGKVDKWERYEGGALRSLDLDLSGSGRPERRILFNPDGTTQSHPLP
jgi:hypothetical protein